MPSVGTIGRREHVMLQTQRAELIRGVFEPPGMFYNSVQRDACEILAEVVRLRDRTAQ